MDHGPWSWSEQLELIWSMVMILGFGQKAILDHDRDLGKMVILDHDPGNRFKIHGHDLKLPWVHSCAYLGYVVQEHRVKKMQNMGTTGGGFPWGRVLR